MSHALWAAALVLLPMVAGYALRRAGLLKRSWARPLMAFNIVFGHSGVVLLTSWNVRMKGELVFLTLTGLTLAMVNMGVGRLAGGVLSLPRRRLGAYIMASSMSNVGYTLGGLLCFLFLGEEALGEQVIYVAYFSFYMVLAVYSVGRYYGEGAQKGFLRAVLASLRDVRSMPLVALAAGLGLNAGGMERPASLAPVTTVLIICATVISMTSVGLTVEVRAVRNYLRECFALAATKFLWTPLLGLGLCYAFGLQGLERKVVFILSTMPCAIFSTVMAELFKLDTDLANSAFLTTTGFFLAAVLPVLVLLLPYI